MTASQSRGGSDWAEFSTYDTESGQKFFVKTSRRDAEMFMGEGAGLRAMHATNTLVIPKVYHAGATPEGRGGGKRSHMRRRSVAVPFVFFISIRFGFTRPDDDECKKPV